MEQDVRTIQSYSVDDTEQIARSLAAHLKGGDVITLTGDLGAGKTSFTQGLAKGLGVQRYVNSPTFTLIKEYQGTSLALYHMDVYRVDDEFEELGFDEYFYGSGVCVIEWPLMIQGQLPHDRLDITIVKKGAEAREFLFEPYGEKYKQLVDKVVFS
jgi:tRNA threonylcarbamoyladenosine biosynthesis protein TsaE